MLIKEALEEIGGKSLPSKMPKVCTCYSTSAKDCITGAKLRKIKGSVCSNCYALKGRYVFTPVQNAHSRRLEKLNTNPNWVKGFDTIVKQSKLDNKTQTKLVRFFDSGDINKLEHLIKFVALAYLNKDCLFWLPTKEYKILSEYKKRGGVVPHNLIIRVSAPFNGVAIAGNYQYSSMTINPTQPAPAGVHVCPAQNQNNTCGGCRACWSSSVKVVAYPTH